MPTTTGGTAPTSSPVTTSATSRYQLLCKMGKERQGQIAATTIGRSTSRPGPPVLLMASARALLSCFSARRSPATSSDRRWRSFMKTAATLADCGTWTPCQAVARWTRPTAPARYCHLSTTTTHLASTTGCSTLAFGTTPEATHTPAALPFQRPFIGDGMDGSSCRLVSRPRLRHNLRPLRRLLEDVQILYPSPLRPRPSAVRLIWMVES